MVPFEVCILLYVTVWTKLRIKVQQTHLEHSFLPCSCKVSANCCTTWWLSLVCTHRCKSKKLVVVLICAGPPWFATWSLPESLSTACHCHIPVLHREDYSGGPSPVYQFTTHVSQGLQWSLRWDMACISSNVLFTVLSWRYVGIIQWMCTCCDTYHTVCWTVGSPVGILLHALREHEWAAEESLPRN